MSISKELKRGSCSDRKHFTYEFNPIRFASQEASLFRSTISSNAEGVLIWLENKKSKQQWQITVTSVGDCGPSGFPEVAVVAFLKRAFELLIVEDEKMDHVEKVRQLQDDDPTLDFLTQENQVSLVLTLRIGGVWNPEFIFDLLPIGLDKIDMLESKLRDAQDEIESLKAEIKSRKVKFMSLVSAVQTAYDQVVTWAYSNDSKLDRDCFSLSACSRLITICKVGVYQVQVRLGGTNRSNCASLKLQVNGITVASCFQSDGHNYQNTAQIFEILCLKANDTLQVRCGADQGSLADVLANRMTILYLGI